MNLHSNSPDPQAGQLALRFISGKYQGGEFPLSEAAPIIVGRSSDLDMVLVEEMVSRRHARIELRDGVVHIEDLGSTNGTFVNGERIHAASLREGDRVLIGTSILKLVRVDTSHLSQRTNMQKVAFGKDTIRQAGPSSNARMAGNLEEIPIPDLMQLFATSRKTGVLVVQSAETGRFYLNDGKIVFAEIVGREQVHSIKAAYRMLSWTQGTFALEPPASELPGKAIELTAQAMLMEGFRQLDELQNLEGQLPPLHARLTLKTPLEAPLHDLAQEKLDVLQVAINAPNFETALDRSPKTDLETAQAVVSLMKNGYVEIDEDY